MRKTLKEIAGIVGGQVHGDEDTVISGISGIKEAEEGDITFLANPKYLSFVQTTRASAIITGPDVEITAKPTIRTDNPSLAFTKLISWLSAGQIIPHPKGIHPTVIIAKTARIGKEVAIGPYAVIEEGVFVGDKTVIYAGCYIGPKTKIGRDCLIYPNVSIRENTEIGERVIIHCSSTIGSDGFGYLTIEGIQQKIPQLGIVVIEDDVEIGANVAIDRARFDKTVIGKGTKIDNLVHIAHNVIIGKNCLIVAQVGISGSTTLGNNVVLAGQVGIVGHVTIGDNSIVMAQSGVSKSVPADTMMWGYPAKPADEAKRVNACVQALPRMHKALMELKKKVEELESKLKER